MSKKQVLGHKTSVILPVKDRGRHNVPLAGVPLSTVSRDCPGTVPELSRSTPRVSRSVLECPEASVPGVSRECPEPVPRGPEGQRFAWFRAETLPSLLQIKDLCQNTPNIKHFSTFCDGPD
eukprot:330933-Amphidinium_carterae.1